MRNGYAPLIRTGVSLARIVPIISGKFLRWNVSGMARQFIAGRNPEDVMKTLRKKRRQGIGFTVDLLGEAVVSEEEASEYMRTAQLIERIVAGENVALVTDAGTPGLSDPGARLIRACLRRGLPFTVLPGASSILIALVGSGFSTEKFLFSGFLPTKSGGRERELRAAAARDETTVFFESPYRLMKTLAAAVEILPAREICVARELTKKFEEYRRGSAAELFAHYKAHPPKGEIVLLISGRSD